MPFYEYECSACSHQMEVLQKISDAPLLKCPDCGKSALKRLISAPVFRLKGAGWYETDFKSENEEKRNIAGREEAEAKADEKAEAKPADSEKGSEAKPADTGKATETRGEPAKAEAKSEPRSVPKPVKVTATGSGKSQAASGKVKQAPGKRVATRAKAGKVKSSAKKKAQRR